MQVTLTHPNGKVETLEIYALTPLRAAVEAAKRYPDLDLAGLGIDPGPNPPRTSTSKFVLKSVGRGKIFIEVTR